MGKTRAIMALLCVLIARYGSAQCVITEVIKTTTDIAKDFATISMPSDPGIDNRFFNIVKKSGEKFARVGENA